MTLPLRNFFLAVLLMLVVPHAGFGESLSPAELSSYSHRLTTKKSREIMQLAREIRARHLNHPLFINALRKYMDMPELTCKDIVAETLISLDNDAGYDYVARKLAAGSPENPIPIVQGLTLLLSAPPSAKAAALVAPYANHENALIRSYALITAITQNQLPPSSEIARSLPQIPSSQQGKLLAALLPHFDQYQDLFATILSDPKGPSYVLAYQIARNPTPAAISGIEKIIDAVKDSYLRVALELVLYENKNRSLEYVMTAYKNGSASERQHMLDLFEALMVVCPKIRTDLVAQLILLEPDETLKRRITTFVPTQKDTAADGISNT